MPKFDLDTPAGISGDHRWMVYRGDTLVFTCRTREEARARIRRQGGQPRPVIVDRLDTIAVTF